MVKFQIMIIPFQTQLNVAKSIITTDKVKVNSAYELSGPYQAGAFPVFFLTFPFKNLTLSQHTELTNYLFMPKESIVMFS